MNDELSFMRGLVLLLAINNILVVLLLYLVLQRVIPRRDDWQKDQ